MVEKRVILRRAALLLALAMLLCALAPAALATGYDPDTAQGTQRVFDDSDLFSDAETAALESQIAAIEQKYGIDVVVLTSDDALLDETQQFADDFFDFNGFGNKSGAGFLYFIDMNNRNPCVSTYGNTVNIIDNDRLDAILNESLAELRRGRYAGAAQVALSCLESDLARGVREGQYQYDTATGRVTTERHKVLTTNEILLAAAAGIVVGLIVCLGVRAKYSLRVNTYHYDAEANIETKITDSADDYVNTTVTRVRRAEPPQGGGGSGGGHGGLGSGTHVSSSGRTHGGGVGGKF